MAHKIKIISERYTAVARAKFAELKDAPDFPQNMADEALRETSENKVFGLATGVSKGSNFPEHEKLLTSHISKIGCPLLIGGVRLSDISKLQTKAPVLLNSITLDPVEDEVQAARNALADSSMSLVVTTSGKQSFHLSPEERSEKCGRLLGRLGMGKEFDSSRLVIDLFTCPRLEAPDALAFALEMHQHIACRMPNLAFLIAPNNLLRSFGNATGPMRPLMTRALFELISERCIDFVLSDKGFDQPKHELQRKDIDEAKRLWLEGQFEDIQTLFYCVATKWITDHPDERFPLLKRPQERTKSAIEEEAFNTYITPLMP